MQMLMKNPEATFLSETPEGLELITPGRTSMISYWNAKEHSLLELGEMLRTHGGSNYAETPLFCFEILPETYLCFDECALWISRSHPWDSMENPLCLFTKSEMLGNEENPLKAMWECLAKLTMPEKENDPDILWRSLFL